jgi:hypothetical protein
MNEFTQAAVAAAEEAQAWRGNAPARVEKFAEAAALASVADALDRAELLAITRATTMEKAMTLYGLAPTESLLDVSALTEDTQAVIRTIVEADDDPDSTAGVVFYDTREGSGFDTQRVAAAASILGLDETAREAIRQVLDAWRNPETIDDEGGQIPADIADDIFGEAKAEAKAKRKAEKKAAKLAEDDER